MKILTWNVNGIRACIKKDFLKIFDTLNPDILCIQETKLQKDTLPNELIDKNNIISNNDNFLCIDTKFGYFSYWHFAKKKGYSGTAIFTKIKPNDVMYGIKDELIDDEGRNITLEFEKFYIVNAYVPNAKPELARIDFRKDYEEKIYKYLCKLNEKKPIIYCGDLNVAHNEIDLKNPNINHNNPGFSDEERNMFSNLIKDDFIDVYRTLYKDKIEYTWWSYRKNARLNNVGWRIDYFVTSKNLLKNINYVKIHNDIYGSDHCPVELDIKRS